MVGTILGGRYRLIELMARGGSSAVYRGVQTNIGRSVAIKVVRADLNEALARQFVPRFEREARVVGSMRHPNIVTVLDYGRSDTGVSYIVMELLDGLTLREMLDQGPLALRRSLRIAVQLIRALRHAHSHGLVHRDIKPGNVLVARGDDGQDFAKLLDFGLVKAGDDLNLTRVGTAMGTPQYISPEQARGEAADLRSDIYSLGVVMYCMFAGAHPYVATSSIAMALAHVREPYPPMHTRAPHQPVPANIEAIVRRCMEKSASRRYQHCDELIQAFADVARQMQIAQGVQQGPTTPVPGATQSVLQPGALTTLPIDAERTSPHLEAAPPDSASAWDSPPPRPAQLATQAPPHMAAPPPVTPQPHVGPPAEPSPTRAHPPARPSHSSTSGSSLAAFLAQQARPGNGGRRKAYGAAAAGLAAALMVGIFSLGSGDDGDAGAPAQDQASLASATLTDALPGAGPAQTISLDGFTLRVSTAERVVGMPTVRPPSPSAKAERPVAATATPTQARAPVTPAGAVTPPGAVTPAAAAPVPAPEAAPVVAPATVTEAADPSPIPRWTGTAGDAAIDLRFQVDQDGTIIGTVRWSGGESRPLVGRAFPSGQMVLTEPGDHDASWTLSRDGDAWTGSRQPGDGGAAQAVALSR